MQTIYRRTFARMALGTIDGLGLPRVPSYENSGADTYETYTLALPAAPDNSTAYGVTVTPAGRPAIAVTFTTDGSATRPELAAGLLAAIRASAIYDLFVPTINVANTVITLTARLISVPYTVAVSGGAGATAITLTRTIQASASTAIPFARVIGQTSTMTGDQCRLFGATNDRILGVSMATHAVEKDRIGPGAIAAWPSGSMVDVCDKSLSTDGIWTECIEASGILRSDPVYVSPTDGRVTRVASGNAAYANARFNSDIAVDINGKTGVLLYLD